MIESFRSTCETYYNELPERTLQTIGISAVYSFTYHLLSMPVLKGRGYEVDLPKLLMAATAAAAASLIHALTTPIFKFIFGDHRVSFLRQAIRSVITILSTDTIFSYASGRKINFGGLQTNPYLPGDLIKMAISDTVSAIDWINTRLVVPCFGENRLQTSWIEQIRGRLTTMGIPPAENTNSVYFAL